VGEICDSCKGSNPDRRILGALKAQFPSAAKGFNDALGLTKYNHRIIPVVWTLIMVSPASFSATSRYRNVLLAAAACLALGLGGCLKRDGSDITGSIGRNVASMTEAEKRVAAEQLGRQYDKRPGDKRISLAYGKMLRDIGQINQAIAVLQSTAVKNPTDREVAAALGKALADGGRFAEAQEVLGRAHAPDRPDWRVLSTQGAIADQMGKHSDAQQYYQAALQLAPGEPNILSNLGLSYALSNRLGEAETILRQAVTNPQASPRVRGNLALVLALQGKYRDSEVMASQDLAPADAAANMDFVRSMTAQNNSWRQLQTLDKKAQVQARR
jgi:Flp pilus assembly protein TadD